MQLKILASLILLFSSSFPAFAQENLFLPGSVTYNNLPGLLVTVPLAAHTLSFTLTAGQEAAVTRARLLWNTDNPTDTAADNDAFLIKIMNRALVTYLRDNEEATAKTVADAYKNASASVKNQVNTLLGISP